jgi:hypothetical protein
MDLGFVQVRCPSCQVDQPARLAIIPEKCDDFTRSNLTATLRIDMRSVNAHVEACRKGRAR